jgi:hypothetical protein
MQAPLIDLDARRNCPMRSIWHRISRPSLSLLDVLVLVAIIGGLAGLLIPGPDFDRTHRYPPVKANTSAALVDFAGVYGVCLTSGSNRFSIDRPSRPRRMATVTMDPSKPGDTS